MEADEETRPSTSNADDIVGPSLGESEGHEISVDEIAKGIDGLIGESILECHEEVKHVVDSQELLHRSLERLGGEVRSLLERIPAAGITSQTAKLPVLRKRCIRLNSKMRDIQDRLNRLTAITETLPGPS